MGLCLKYTKISQACSKMTCSFLVKGIEKADLAYLNNDGMNDKIKCLVQSDSDTVAF